MAQSDKEVSSSLNEDIILSIKDGATELEESKLIMSVTTSCEFQKLASAEIVFNDGGKSDDDFTIGQSESLSVGKELEVSVGGSEKQETVFKGVVVKNAMHLSKGSTELVVTLKHIAYKMTLERKIRSFEDVTDSEIINEICSEYGISADVEDTNVTHERMVQYNCTDWDFINMRAEANGLLLFTSNDGIVAKVPVLDDDPVLTLTNDFNINEVNLEMDGRYSFENFVTRAWNYTSQQEEEVSEKGNQFDFPQGDADSTKLASLTGNSDANTFFMGSCENSDGLVAETKAMVMRNNLSRIVGDVNIAGNASLLPSNMVEFEGIGKKFNGKTIVSSVRHTVKPGQWETQLEVGFGNILYISKYDDVIAEPANGAVPGVNGLQIAKVDALEGDPLSEGRIYLRLMNSENTKLWARIATLDAGNERGSFFLPELEDEVIVGFVDDDPNKAVVLGMLHNSQAPHPCEITDDNNIKGFTTREKIVLEFDDDKKAVRIETPGGNKILISDDEKGISLVDQNGNSIVMNDQGVNIESKKALTIKAAQDVNIEGTNINIKANAQFKAEGSASAEVSSGGTMVVKGGIVQIN